MAEPIDIRLYDYFAGQTRFGVHSAYLFGSHAEGRVHRESDMDVLFSLQMVCQLVIDIAGELSARRGCASRTYTTAIRNLHALERFPQAVVQELERLPGFRNVLVHAYVDLDLDRAVQAASRAG
ncbi:MAG: HepT-like ribonuclease domain-containing protein [Gemmatimonadota bacterium]